MFVKVVRKRNDGILVSSFASGEWRAVYKPGEWTEPPVEGSKLWLYKVPDGASVEEIAELCNEWGVRTEPWLCEADGVVIPRTIQYSVNAYYWNRFWENGGVDVWPLSSFYDSAITGSMRLADKIKLVRIISTEPPNRR